MPIALPRHAYARALVALGAAIRASRLEKSVSQEDLADLAALDRPYMASIECGAQNPGIVTILRVAKALNLSVVELFARAAL